MQKLRGSLLWILLPLLVSVPLTFWILHSGLPLLPDPIGTRASLFLEGTRTTLMLTFYAGTLGLLIGLIAALARCKSRPLLNFFTLSWIEFFRGTPLLVQLYLIYFALPTLFPIIRLNEFNAAVLALGLNVGAYNAEVIRAGINAVPKGQTEAARTLGLSPWQTMRYVVLPQAFRIVIAPLMNNIIALLKDSSLASVLGLLELSLAANRTISETYLPVPALTTIAMIYLILTLLLSIPTRILESYK